MPLVTWCGRRSGSGHRKRPSCVSYCKGAPECDHDRNAYAFGLADRVRAEGRVVRLHAASDALCLPE